MSCNILLACGVVVERCLDEIASVRSQNKKLSFVSLKPLFSLGYKFISRVIHLLLITISEPAEQKIKN